MLSPPSISSSSRHNLLFPPPPGVWSLLRLSNDGSRNCFYQDISRTSLCCGQCFPPQCLMAAARCLESTMLLTSSSPRRCAQHNPLRPEATSAAERLGPHRVSGAGDEGRTGARTVVAGVRILHHRMRAGNEATADGSQSHVAAAIGPRPGLVTWRRSARVDSGNRFLRPISALSGHRANAHCCCSAVCQLPSLPWTEWTKGVARTADFRRAPTAGRS